jgi:Flp pilus assembly protein TadG
MNMKVMAYIKSSFDRACRMRRGQSLVEFALVAPLFFMLVFGITDFGRLFFTKATLQHAVREAGRFAVTGRHLTDSGGNTMSRVESIRKIAMQQAAGLLVNPSDIQVTSTFGGASSNNFAGGPGEVIVVSLTTELRLITPIIGQFFGPGGIYTFIVRTSFKNEPFDLSPADW